MKRETTNCIRFVLEECIPPILRDSKIFLYLASLAYGKHLYELAEFRKKSWKITDQEYEALYRNHPRVHGFTDNSKKCISLILDTVVGESVLDVGCGTGYLIEKIKSSFPNKYCMGVDIGCKHLSGDASNSTTRVDFQAARIENLPFTDDSFDTVICTHTLEHVLDIHVCLRELRRVAHRRLIIVVPKERESQTAFNPHLQFFPYQHSLLRVLRPLVPFQLFEINRDFFYCEYIDR